jgi:hypothetical protein
MEGLKGEAKAFTHRDEEKVERLRAKDHHPNLRVMNKKHEGLKKAQSEEGLSSPFSTPSFSPLFKQSLTQEAEEDV